MYGAAMAGDTARLFGYFTGDVVVTEPPFLPYGGQHAGLAGFQALFGEIVKYLDVGSIKLESIIADEEVAMAFMRIKPIKGGRDVQMAERLVIRDGKITEMRIYFHDFGGFGPDALRGERA
jgi:hypothetical protein